MDAGQKNDSRLRQIAVEKGTSPSGFAGGIAYEPQAGVPKVSQPGAPAQSGIATGNPSKPMVDGGAPPAAQPQGVPFKLGGT